MNKTAIKNFAVWARGKLVKDIKYRAGLMGISEKGISEPISKSEKDMVFNVSNDHIYTINGIELSQRENLIRKIRRKEKKSDYTTAYNYIIEEVAYTWFNRLIAIRFMEVNDYLPSHIRVLSSESDTKREPDLVTNPFDGDLYFNDDEKDKIIELQNENKLDDLFRILFIKQCNALSKYLPGLFEKEKDYTELLCYVTFTDKDDVVYKLTHDIDEDDFNIEKGGQVEIIGWLYQYYNSELKDETYALLKKNIKVTAERIPAATQLFTPDWIVRYMVENSLGRLWYEGHKDDGLKSKWKYYVDEAEQEAEVQAQLDEIRKGYGEIKPEEIKIIDPCMGSGHILVYAFDVLMSIYESCGYTQREAAKYIVEKNLYGLELDKRAYQLAYFALMMKGREYDRRFLRREIKPNIRHFQDIDYIQRDYLPDEMKKLVDQFEDCENIGSLIEIEPGDSEKLDEEIDHMSSTLLVQSDDIEHIVILRNILLQKYDVVVTNPPYMGGSNMNDNLAEFVKKNYKDYKSDTFSAFIIRCTKFAKEDGYLGFLTPYVWMFIQSYEKLRKVLYSKTIETLIQFEYSAFEEATVPICTFVFKNSYISKKGCYFRLTDFKGGMEVQRQKTLEAINNHGCGFYYEASTDNFEKIPGAPVAYWVSEKFINAYKNGVCLVELAKPKAGLATGDNNLFERIWFEVCFQRIGFNYKNTEDTKKCLHKWFPCNSGGEFRKWYFNKELVVNWYNDGVEVKNFRNATGKLASRPQNTQYYFKEGLTWNKLSSSRFAVKYKDKGFIYDDTSRSVFLNDKSIIYYLLALLCSNVSFEYLKILNPTMSFTNNDIERIPYLYSEVNKIQIDKLVKENISISKVDWDSFETSWDFVRHPLVRGDSIRSFVLDAFCEWENECNERFNQLKANEEELNRIFIDIYGLQDELTPEVEDKDVTVHRIFNTKEDVTESMKGSNYVRTKRDEIVSLISYAVGCMFGRYSLAEEGLIYAGGDWDEKFGAYTATNGELSEYTYGELKNFKYGDLKKKFYYLKSENKKAFYCNRVDYDNIIPITDEEYFEDDIVGLFCKWIEKAYGKKTLENNLDFIANALGNKGNSSREVIRNYFLKDFFKDHCKIYQKRPIYWLFDSGKQNGFKALIYMHRYDENTVGNLRVDYLHRMQHVYEKEIDRMQDTINNSSDGREKADATKRKEKLLKQLKECKEYDEKIAHVALARIPIDLDDGVKVNYEKVQTVEGVKYQVLSKV